MVENGSDWGEDRVQGFNYVFFISHHIFNMGGETGFAALHVFFLIFPPTVSYSINLFFYR